MNIPIFKWGSRRTEMLRNLPNNGHLINDENGDQSTVGPTLHEHNHTLPFGVPVFV